MLSMIDSCTILSLWIIESLAERQVLLIMLCYTCIHIHLIIIYIVIEVGNFPSTWEKHNNLYTSVNLFCFSLIFKNQMRKFQSSCVFNIYIIVTVVFFDTIYLTNAVRTINVNVTSLETGILLLPSSNNHKGHT